METNWIAEARYWLAGKIFKLWLKVQGISENDYWAQVYDTAIEHYRKQKGIKK